jgi:integrase
LFAITLGVYLTTWLNDTVKPNLSPRTHEGYKSIIEKHLIPSNIGQIPLTKIKPADIQIYYSEKLKSGLSNRTVLHHAMCLHGAIKNAVKTGLIPYNICDATTVPKAERKEMKVMTEKEIQIFLDLARDSRYHTLFYLALFSGMRRGELLGLKWSDVDFLGMQTTVKRSLYQLANSEIVIRNPKTDSSRRPVPLSPSVCDILRKEYAKQKALHREIQEKAQETAQKSGKKSEEIPWTDDKYIFSEWNGKHFLPNSVSHAWQKMAKKSGLTGVRLHDSRHSCATIMLEGGIHPKVVSEILGHSSITVTLDTYSHVIPGLKQAAAKKFDEMVLPKADPETEKRAGQ